MHRSVIKQHGFTLIEMIVSLGVFAVVVTITAGALLMLIGGNQRFQNTQNVMTNLSFAIDSMTRELRTGTYYVCDFKNSHTIFKTQESIDNNDEAERVEDCSNGRTRSGSGSDDWHGVSFVEGGHSITGSTGAARIAYIYDPGDQKLYRRVGDGDLESILSDSIIVSDADFTVTGTEAFFDNPVTASADVAQPTVTVFIEAYAASDDAADPQRYYVQSTITQRALDL